jgi:dTDP-4-dehydrorhamnose 3,5-epimerase
MQIVRTTLEGVLLVRPAVHGDERGFFAETFREDALAGAGITTRWVQDNHSRSARGVLRGLHFQTHPGQEKLVRCARGAIFDAVVDIRRGSPTFGRWEGFALDDRTLEAVYVPVGFAHGFCVVSDVADVVYKCSNYYDPATEAGFAWDDPDVRVGWPTDDVQVSQRDAEAPRLHDIADGLPFTYGGPPPAR